MANEIEVRLLLDDGSYQKALLDVSQLSKKEGKKIGKNLEAAGDMFKNKLSGLTKSIIGLGTAYFGVMGAKKIIAASRRQQDAVSELNNALILAGTYSAEASRQMQEFAAGIERTTTISDEAVLEQLKLARAYTKTNEEAIKLTNAGVELAARMDIDISSAVRNLGKSYSGLLGELGEMLPATRGLSQEMLQSGAAVQFVLDNFGGAAAAKTQTFSGAVVQLENAFGTLLEKLGDAFTESKVLREAFSQLAKLFDTLASRTGEMNLGSIFDDMIISILGVGQAINYVFGVPLEIAYNAVKVSVNGIRLMFQTMIKALADTGAYWVNMFAPQSDLAKKLADFAGTSGRLFQEIEMDAASSLMNIGDTSVTDGMDVILEKMEQMAVKAKNTGDAFSKMNDQIAPGEKVIGDTQTSYEVLSESMSSFKEGFKKQTEDMQTNAQKTFKQIGASAMQGIGNAAGSAFAAFGKALHDGENSLEAFLNSLLASMGQMAIQLGTQFILQGLAYQWAGMPNGGALIAAGAALAAFGGVLAAAGGGDKGAGATASATEETTEDEDALTGPDDLMGRRPEVNVRIEGNVFDRRETGLAIVDIINESLEMDGARLRTV